MAFVNDEPNRLAVDALELQPTDHVLELGCGPGRAIRTIAARATKGKIFGIDQSDRMLRQATNMNEVAVARGRVVLSKGPFSPLPWIDSTFQKILLVNVVYFFDADGRDAAEVHRVLRPGGRVVVYVTSRETMAKWPFATPRTHKLYDRGALMDLLSGAGFRSSNIEIKDVLLPFGIKGLLATAVKSPYLVRIDAGVVGSALVDDYSRP
jgi:SAM-dependent methyltransferase